MNLPLTLPPLSSNPQVWSFMADEYSNTLAKARALRGLRLPRMLCVCPAGDMLLTLFPVWSFSGPPAGPLLGGRLAGHAVLRHRSGQLVSEFA